MTPFKEDIEIIFTEKSDVWNSDNSSDEEDNLNSRQLLSKKTKEIGIDANGTIRGKITAFDWSTSTGLINNELVFHYPESMKSKILLNKEHIRYMLQIGDWVKGHYQRDAVTLEGKVSNLQPLRILKLCGRITKHQIHGNIISGCINSDCFFSSVMTDFVPNDYIPTHGQNVLVNAIEYQMDENDIDSDYKHQKTKYPRFAYYCVYRALSIQKMTGINRDTTDQGSILYTPEFSVQGPELKEDKARPRISGLAKFMKSYNVPKTLEQKVINEQDYSDIPEIVETIAITSTRKNFIGLIYNFIFFDLLNF